MSNRTRERKYEESMPTDDFANSTHECTGNVRLCPNRKRIFSSAPNSNFSPGFPAQSIASVISLSGLVLFCVSVEQGDRFGGALNGAAKQFSEAYDTGLHPMEFVNEMRKKGQLIMGIGHRVKSVSF